MKKIALVVPSVDDFIYLNWFYKKGNTQFAAVLTNKQTNTCNFGIPIFDFCEFDDFLNIEFDACYFGSDLICKKTFIEYLITTLRNKGVEIFGHYVSNLCVKEIEVTEHIYEEYFSYINEVNYDILDSKTPTVFLVGIDNLSRFDKIETYIFDKLYQLTKNIVYISSNLSVLNKNENKYPFFKLYSEKQEDGRCSYDNISLQIVGVPSSIYNLAQDDMDVLQKNIFSLIERTKSTYIIVNLYNKEQIFQQGDYIKQAERSLCNRECDAYVYTYWSKDYLDKKLGLKIDDQYYEDDMILDHLVDSIVAKMKLMEETK